MSELRSIIAGTTKRSLVLVDEICRGTETAKGTCIAGSIIETLDKVGCLGIVSTHLHGIFTLPLNLKNTVHKAMGTMCIDGQTKPTWKLLDGICKESLAFETARREGIPDTIIKRAEDLHLSMHARELLSAENFPNQEEFSTFMNFNSNGTHLHSKRFISGASHERMALANQMEVLHQEVESAITMICQEKIKELRRKKNVSELTDIKCVLIGAREKPPPSTIGSSSVYVMLRPDKKLYVGEVYLLNFTVFLITRLLSFFFYFFRYLWLVLQSQKKKNKRKKLTQCKHNLLTYKGGCWIRQSIETIDPSRSQYQNQLIVAPIVSNYF